ncbi:amino acid ABC transporter substrate-binding protein [Parafrankia colletiae]|uniref:Amino acid ABC transporter substrate-binding protein n=1 Tax=Parafrankia colletiae TaxID=573497 RepID=A0A1S1Q812_9ACTN|nr:ABC transporter substrate-binding protein [Parafrankia colletiae]MCK9898958.1 ABC transporter substrate-binding protein [Frankia sp. Cpl3]OHV29335.1 amino acid ABC transporter substrate-binding protein [Parafrankia colletiae]
MTVRPSAPRAAAVAALAAVVALLLAIAGCAESTDGQLGSLTVADAGFTESKILADMYGELLGQAGYQVERTSVQNTEIAQSALEDGRIDAMPQYVATYAGLLNSQLGPGRSAGDDTAAEATGPAGSIVSSDLDSTLRLLRGLADEVGLSVLEPADAVDQNAFAVSRTFAERHHLTSLSDLGASGLPVRLAAGAECANRPFCEPGLVRVYGIRISGIIETGVATAQTKAAVRDDIAQLGLVLTTDATVADYDLVVLTDDRKLQNADNLVPIVHSGSLTPEIADALNALAPVLTTADLAELNKKVDAERQKSEDVARDYLTDRGLLGA